MNSIQLTAIENFPLIKPNDNLVNIIIDCIASSDISIDDGDIFVIAQKIVSKSENRYIDLKSVKVDIDTNELALTINKDPRLLQLIKNESNKIISTDKNVVIVEHKLGYINVNAGIDVSNIPDNSEQVLLLPENPTLSSNDICNDLSKKIQKNISVIISDSMTRPFRAGVINFALASTNIPSLEDITNQKDLYGNSFKCTEVAIADELASAAGLIMGQGNEQKPVIIIKGFDKNNCPEFNASDLVVTEKNDLYR
tara:strand:- start:3036 stop:3797 length:762 start_codon:yes stop_codon:yes gene_type:complete